MYQTILILLVVLACIGVLHPAFDDNLFQRAALGLIALGALAEALDPGQHPRLLLASGCLVYAVGTAIKSWQYRNTTH